MIIFAGRRGRRVDRDSASPGGGASRKRPWLSVLVRATSCIPCASFSRITSSPAAGLSMVLLTTVPVISAAKADNEKTASREAVRNVVAQEKIKISPKGFL